MSFTKSVPKLLLSVFLLSMLCCLDAKPAIFTNDKGVHLPIGASVFNQSWCRSALFKERITEPGCEAKLVYNRFCYGQCMSFYVPRYPTENFRSCTACVPFLKEKKLIRLKCPGRKNALLFKEILFVKSCRCRSGILENPKDVN